MFVLLGTLALVSLSILWMGYVCLTRKLRTRYPEPHEFAPISILKPLKGVEDGLYENLKAIALQDYPEFEIIFAAEDATDLALAVAARVQAEHPERAIRILAGGFPRGLNPKVRLLRTMAPEARHDWILISDSNVRPPPRYLRELRGCQVAENAALVHNLLGSRGRGSLGVRLENLHMNGWVAASIALCDAGEHPCVIGKSMLLRRSDLERLGGFSLVEDILAEDYILGATYMAAGLRVTLSPFVLPVVSGGRDLASFFNRHVRWGQLRRRISPHFFAGELLVNPVPLFLATWFVAPPGLWGFAAAGLGLKWLSDVLMYRRFGYSPDLPSLLILPFKDLLVVVVWLLSALLTRVNWRGNRMQIGPGSRLFPAAPVLDTAAAESGTPGLLPGGEWQGSAVSPQA